MLKFVFQVGFGMLLVTGFVWAEDLPTASSPDDVFRRLEELRAQIEDAYQRERGGTYVSSAELNKMTPEQSNAVVLEASIRERDLRKIRDDAFEEAEDLVTMLVPELLARGTLEWVLSQYPSNRMLKWVDGNGAYTNEGRDKLGGAVHTDLAFFSAAYQAYEAGPGNTLYVFELFGATPNPLAEGTGRAWSTSAFLVRKTADEVVLHRLEEEGRNGWRESFALYGATPAQDNAWPFLVLIEGPEGTAHAARISRLDIDAVSDMVLINLVADTSGFWDFRFDPNTGAVYYPVSEGAGDENNERAYKAGEVEPGGPMEFTKGIHFPIQGRANGPSR